MPIAQRYFGLADDSRLNNHVIDGRRFLHDSPNRYDLIFVDVYRSFASVPMQFTTLEFFQLAQQRLAEEGVFIANFYASLSPDIRPLVDSIHATMRRVFPQVYLFATVDPDGEELQNFIFVGHNRAPQKQRIDPRLAADTSFAYSELQRIAELEIGARPEVLDRALLLTDDYAPVEYYSARILRRYDALLGARKTTD